MAKTKGALIDNQRMPELFKFYEWLRSPMRRMASLKQIMIEQRSDTALLQHHLILPYDIMISSWLTVLWLYYSSIVPRYYICYYIDIIVLKFRLPVFKVDHLFHYR